MVVGGGMAGLSAALVCARAGRAVTLLEQAPVFSEVGAGIQLGPNATRVLRDWGLEAALAGCAAFPDELRVRDARTGVEWARMRLGAQARDRYGSPYATVHRADLHGLLFDAVRALGRVDVRPGQRLQALRPLPEGVEAETPEGSAGRARVLLGCDGLWSRVRALVLDDGAPVFSGHLAYRGLVRMDDVPLRQRLNRVSAWLGPRLHAVHYPVRGGQWMNVVVVVHGPLPADVPGWDHGADGTGLRQALGPVAADLEAVLQAVPAWRLWPLHARRPMRGPQEQAQGRVALLGDAAHPMPPYLAQGAAMALEDAWTLGRLLGGSSRTQDGPGLLSAFAQARWRRNAWVQARSRRNGAIFHARGPLRWGRNLAMTLLGERVLDVPRLYAGPVWPG